ncbi:MAG: hypothetical protein L3K18_08535 [Thermoplasmata archaeon]|nr:hypothetical protein [Thermoplasmata archaeon]MCI4357162.1 hypothetical protein [Thermoplasmata archaeon]
MDNTALGAGIASLVGAALYLFVGWRISRRAVSPESRFAASQFTLFWIALSGATAIGGLLSLVAAFTTPALALAVTITDLNILLACALLWGLVGYLVYLYTGRGFVVPLAVLYGTLYVLLLYYLTAGDATSVVVTAGTVGVTYTTPVGGPILGVLAILLIVPEFLASFAYFTLVFRTKDRTIRYRVALVSWSLIAWFSIGSANIGAALGGGLAAEVFGRSIGDIAALVILLAYYPPMAIRNRLGVAPIQSRS